jgi:hypothetical protein
MLSTPVLLIVFNRPDLTSLMMKALAEVRPADLYIAADGPRDHVAGEAARCQETRDVATTLNWPCRLHLLFSPTNRGCKRAVQTALDWFFGEVEEGIIIEDDCLPSKDFFAFCERGLSHFRHDQRVMSICGSSYIEGGRDIYFSYYADIWGWATWRRAWRLYDRDMVAWSEFERSGGLQAILGGRNAAEAYWRGSFDRTAAGQIDTWDYQWIFSVMRHGGLACYPPRNTISNMGFRSDATHTTQTNIPIAAARPHQPMQESSLAFGTPVLRSSRIDAEIETLRHDVIHGMGQHSPSEVGHQPIEQTVQRRPGGRGQVSVNGGGGDAGVAEQS